MRHRFIFVVGGTPQIVTETLWWWAVVHRPSIAPHDVHLLTTTIGATLARGHLLGPKGRLARFAADYGLPSFQTSLLVLKDRRGKMLDDIRTTRQNEDAGRSILRIVTRLTEDPGVICHFSVAGGRRTLGLHLATSAIFRARRDDTLSHVIVPSDRESDLEVFYPRPGETRSGVDLSFLPFLRLRAYTSNGATLADHVAAFQEQLERGFCLPRVEVNLGRSELHIGSIAIPLPRQQIALWCVYALVSKDGLDMPGLVAAYDAYVSYLKSAGADPERSEMIAAWRECVLGAGNRQSELEERLLQLRAKLIRRLRIALADPILDSHANIRSINGKEGAARRYGVRIDPTRIRIVSRPGGRP